MRNLKKALALVLALVMSLSLTVTAGAAYTDGDQITDDYAVAVEVASQLGILVGFEDGSYGPQKTLTRAQLATMIYRITTGDVEDVYTANFAGGAAQSFTDTPATAWYAGYVAYSADAGFLKGMGDGTYGPNKTLTGYQALAALLRGLGYNQVGHNFCGDDWKVQVAKVATANGILEGVTAELDKAISREVAAQMIYNALFAEMVEWEGMVYEKTGDTLAEEVFGIVTDKDGDKNVAGDFGRPSTEWYEAGEDDAVVSIPEAPLAVYTEAVELCDVLDDTGLEEDKVMDVYLDGDDIESLTLADTTATIGEQGRLTEVYEDVIVFIDTYLAEVVDVNAEKVDGNGHVTDEANIELNIYFNDNGVDKYFFDTKSFAEGDMVLVSIDDGEVATVVDADSEIGELTGLTGNIRHTGDIQDVLAIDGKDVTVNHTATYEEIELWLDINYVFYYDTYGNVIGSEEVANQYAVIDSIWFETIKGETTIYADIVDFDGNETEEVVVADNWTNFFIQENKVLNQPFYYDAVEFLVEDGEYFFMPAFVDFGAVDYTEGDVTLTPSAQVHPTQLNDDTVLLLQTAFSPDGQYTSYTGYETFPSFWASEVEVLDEDGDGYADLVYALGARMSERTVFIADIAPVRTDRVDNETIVTMEALELVDGELVETSFAIEGWWAPTGWAPLGIHGVGLYEIAESEDGFTWAVQREIPVERVASVTSDGNRVFIGEPGEDEFVVLDDAEVFKFEGNWALVEDMTEEDEWTKADLDDESMIFIQENEDGDVVAVYDMWILLNVIDEDNVVMNNPVIYAGKYTTESLEMMVPEHTGYTVTTRGETVFETAADAHDCDDCTYCVETAWDLALNDTYFGDIVVDTFAIDLHKHIKMQSTMDEVVVDGAAQTITVDVSTFETFTVADLMAALAPACGHVQSIAAFDNTGAFAGDLVKFVGKADITIEAVAEDGTVYEYEVVING